MKPLPQSVLDANAIHLWHIDLRADDSTLQACAALLSTDETARAQRFRLPHLSNRYIIAHGAMRSILSSYLPIFPEALHFSYGPQRKPFLDPETNSHLLFFNLSHSKDRAVLAVTQQNHIGVDIESIESNRDINQIAASHFSPAEASAVINLQGNAHIHSFFACWTAKEAYLKAIGTGLSTPLDSFDFVFPPNAPTRLIRVGSSPDEHLRWQTFAFTQDSYAIAVVVEGQNHVMHRKTWQP